MMSFEKAKLVSDVIAIWVSFGTLVAAGTFAIVEYNAKVRGDRVKETMEFLDRYGNDRLENARDRIMAAWDSYSDDLTKLSTGTAFDDQGFKQVVLEMVKTKNIQADLLKVFDFYSALEVCIEQEICDRRSAVKIFQPEASALFNGFQPFIIDYRCKHGDMTIAASIENLANMRSALAGPVTLAPRDPKPKNPCLAHSENK